MKNDLNPERLHIVRSIRSLREIGQVELNLKKTQFYGGLSRATWKPRGTRH